MLARSATQDRYFLCLAEFPSKQVISEEGVADVAGIQPGPGCMQGDNAGQTSEHCCSNLRHGYGYQMQLALSFTTKQPTVPAAARVTTKPFCFHSHARKFRKFKRTALRLSTTTGLCSAGTMQCGCALLCRKSHLILPVCNGRKLQDRREEQLSNRNKVWMLYLY